MQIKLPNDLVTCLLRFMVRHFLRGVEKEGVFIGSENELRSVSWKPPFQGQNDGCYCYLSTNLYSNAWMIPQLFCPHSLNVIVEASSLGLKSSVIEYYDSLL